MSNPVEISLPIVRVTVFEDRAEVVREAEISLSGEGEVVVVRDLSPLLSEDRVVASLESGDGAEAHVDDVTVEHLWVRDKSVDRERFQELEDEVRGAHEALIVASERLQSLRLHEGTMGKLMGRYADETGKVVARGDGVSELWEDGLRAFEEKLDALIEERAATRAELEKAEREEEKLQGLLSDVMKRRQRYTSELYLRLSGDAGTVTLRVACTVPCALWRPSHEAHLQADGTVEWTTFANVWQKTGEDWNDVELTLSTARPSAGAELPRLQADRLRAREKTAEEQKTIFVEHRHEAVPRDSLSGAAPGVYDGGEPRRLAPEGTVDIPSDGRSYRVAVLSFNSAAAVDRVAMPELSQHVFERARLRNRAGTPLLAGPVSLLARGMYVGIGDLSFVGIDEDFDLSFGSDDRFNVSLVRRRHVEKRRLTKDRTHFYVEAELRYTGSENEDVVVLLRLPKSEVAQLKVIPSEDYCQPWPPEEDEHGLVRAPVTLVPGERSEVRLGFYFETSGNVEVPDPW